jgi:hypothetical protein
VQELARLLQERENWSWPSISVESVDSDCWFLNNANFYAFIMRLTVEERVFILESYLKTMSFAHCRQSSFEKFRILKKNITRAIKEVNERTLRKVARNTVKHVDKCIEMNGHYFQHLL